ncbi:MAG: FAD binding domain-containing protein [Chloroflexota bacterium]
MHKHYHAPTSIDEALQLRAHYGNQARLIAGGTDLLIELDRGTRQTDTLIDLTRIPNLSNIWKEDGQIHLGALVTHNQCVASPLLVEKAFPLVRACWEVGAPQIRNRATVVGNVVTASPANDTIVPLMALDATVTLQSAARGRRVVPLSQFIMGFRQVDLADDEMVMCVSFAPLSENAAGTFIKLGLRRAQAISVISVAAIIEQVDGVVAKAAISLGAVSPVIVRATVAEQSLVGQPLTEERIVQAATLALDVATPIDDVRSSADYRRGMVDTLVARILRQIRDGEARSGWVENPVLLQGQSISNSSEEQTQARVNGQPITLAGQMTLLDSLREAGFTGVKEGCAEGECGSCTVYLNGDAVMACLVPAERAHGSDVVTIEGLGDVARLHPLQDALIQSGGVQCGYCTPGFVMSAAKLLEENPRPTRSQAQEALTGNLCRCTGYRKILDAVMMAAG